MNISSFNMPGAPNYPTMSRYCSCEDCLYGFPESCIFPRMHRQHSQTVGAILASGNHEMLEIGFIVNQDVHYVTCHSSLICYWSATIRNTVYAQTHPVRRIWIEFEQRDGQIIASWKQIVQWCYTGSLFDSNNVSEVVIGFADDLEVLWNVAISLEMNELANYCMHLIFVKYSWGLSARANIIEKIHPRDCPFDVWGPHRVYTSGYKLGSRYRKLLEFMEDLVSAGGPLAPRKRERANQATIQGWETVLEEDEGFRNWLEILGGAEHQGDEAVLPTHFNQWATYMVPVLPRNPENVHEWSEAHYAKTRFNSYPIDLCGVYQNEGAEENPDFRWVFFGVPLASFG